MPISDFWISRGQDFAGTDPGGSCVIDSKSDWLGELS